MFKQLFLAVVFLASFTSTQAIIVRHDREDSRYIALGSNFPSYCRINLPDGGGGLIADQWILTAAHVAEEIKTFPHKVSCESVLRDVERVFIHPEYKENGRRDIALIKLSEPIKGIKPVPIYTEQDEAKQIATLVGHYITGNGKTGPDKKLKREMRGATNRIETTNDYWLYFNFDTPDSNAATDLEGVSGPGDSGAPAYLTINGKLYVAGISSRSRDANGDGVEPGYEDEDLYARVSIYKDWITKTINIESSLKPFRVDKQRDIPRGVNTATKKEFDITVSGELGAKLDGHLAQIVPKGFSGAFLIAKNGKVLLEKGYGLANRENKTSYAPETVFDIGSITKQFTGAAILKLEMQGKLSTTDKIGTYFKDAPPDKANITLHQLLTHSAGLIDLLGGDYDKLSREDMIRGAFASKLLFAPGERYEYSNLGYSLLAAIIEMTSRQSYERYLHENLFKPAGMKRTGYSIPKWKPQTVAAGYRSDNTNWGTPLDKLWDKDQPFWNLRGNGGILSTVGDLYKWHLALSGEKILSKAAKDKYTTPHVAEQAAGKSFYGYGWVTQKTKRGTTLVSHDGGNAVFYALFRRYVDEDTVIIMASNAPLKPVAKEIAEVSQIVFEAATNAGQTIK
jgi:CubicO group peptidase (beta-lactamase class C family)